MGIDIIELNGRCKHLDYDELKSSFIRHLGEKCDVKIYALNAFPALVSAEIHIDLLLIIALKDVKGNYYLINKNEKGCYLHNQIIPIRFIEDYKESDLEISGNYISDNGVYVDYLSEITSLKFGTRNYLAKRCKLDLKNLYVEPLVFIRNDKSVVMDNCLIAPQFDFDSLSKYFKENNKEVFISYKPWKEEEHYLLLDNVIKRINEQASIDSELGYLTKKKIERIAKKVSSANVIESDLNKKLLIIQGKAGSGKTSELMRLTATTLEQGQNALYLTYNHLLVYELSSVFHSLQNKRFRESGKLKTSVAVQTLHSFFYRLSLNLGVLHILTEARLTELGGIFRDRMASVYRFITPSIDFKSSINFDGLKTSIQNNPDFDMGTKEVGVKWLSNLEKRSPKNKERYNLLTKNYVNYEKQKISSINTQDIFFTDYYGVLKETLNLIRDPDTVYDNYIVRDMYDALSLLPKGVNKNYVEVVNGKNIITKKGFKESKNRSVGSFRNNRTLFVDEAQDCHPLERELLFEVFRPENIVVADGGKEQLIRYVELCKWDTKLVLRNTEVRKVNKKNKSYRTKKLIADFCNFIGQHFKVDLNLETIDSPDQGRVIIDTRKNTPDLLAAEINSLVRVGEINQCSPNEGLLILANSEGSDLVEERIVVNEYGNTEVQYDTIDGVWKYEDVLVNQDIVIWNGMGNTKTELPIPSAYETKAIYYESCRGLEAWSVACLGMDSFFKRKRAEDDAELFMVEDEKKNKTLDLYKYTNEDRKDMYAATWALMAATRAMDTLYIQVDNVNSDFGRAILLYAKSYPENVTLL